jgi:hypothetical protein
MLSKTRSTPGRSPAPGVIPETITGPVSDESPVATDPDRAPAQAAAATAIDREKVRAPDDRSGARPRRTSRKRVRPRALGARADGALRDRTVRVAPPQGMGRSHDASERAAMPVAEIEPTISATLRDGPLEGSSIEVAVVEGRPPKTIDAPADDGSTCRYCLANWVQSGRSAVYTFLYRV